MKKFAIVHIITPSTDLFYVCFIICNLCLNNVENGAKPSPNIIVMQDIVY